MKYLLLGFLLLLAEVPASAQCLSFRDITLLMEKSEQAQQKWLRSQGFAQVSRDVYPVSSGPGAARTFYSKAANAHLIFRQRRRPDLPAEVLYAFPNAACYAALGKEVRAAGLVGKCYNEEANGSSTSFSNARYVATIFQTTAVAGSPRH